MSVGQGVRAVDVDAGVDDGASSSSSSSLSLIDDGAGVTVSVDSVACGSEGHGDLELDAVGAVVVVLVVSAVEDATGVGAAVVGCTSDGQGALVVVAVDSESDEVAAGVGAGVVGCTSDGHGVLLDDPVVSVCSTELSSSDVVADGVDAGASVAVGCTSEGHGVFAVDPVASVCSTELSSSDVVAAGVDAGASVAAGCTSDGHGVLPDDSVVSVCSTDSSSSDVAVASDGHGVFAALPLSYPAATTTPTSVCETSVSANVYELPACATPIEDDATAARTHTVATTLRAISFLRW